MLPQHLNAFLGAAVLGAIGAAGLFFMQHYRQERMRHAMARDLARLDKELARLRNELRQIQNQQNERPNRHRRNNKQSNSRKANSILSTNSDDYLSASNIDSSDLEFYDVSEDEVDIKSFSLDLVLNELDRRLNMDDEEAIEEALQKLEDLCIEDPDNPELLYRIGKAHHKVADKSEDKEFCQQRISRGIEACSRAVKLAPDHADVNKWFAILVGSRSHFQSLQDRINDGHLFKKHVDKAISLNPDDASLHYMLGRFSYEVAGLKWYERKLASALFGEPPNATFEDAYKHFLEAERLANFEWKENKLMLGKCKIAMGEPKEGVKWLESANRCRQSDGVDDKVDSEVNELLEKYNSYR